MLSQAALTFELRVTKHNHRHSNKCVCILSTMHN